MPPVDMVPPVVDHVTPVLLLPVTVAANCCVAPVFRVAEPGLTETATAGAAVTVTLAVADFVESAALVALTVYVPAVLGAVYSPVGEMLPPFTDQVTLVLELPVTVALNCKVAPVVAAGFVGVSETATVLDDPLVEDGTKTTSRK